MLAANASNTVVASGSKVSGENCKASSACEIKTGSAKSISELRNTTAATTSIFQKCGLK